MSSAIHERDATLKPEYYAYILRRFEALSHDELASLLNEYAYICPTDASRLELEELILEEPASFLFHDYRLLEKPAECTGTFLSFDDGKDDAGVNYFIDATAAEAIALGQHSAILQRIDDGAPFLVPVERIRSAFKNHCSIDYKEER